jgi:hypothetical protein
MQIRQSDIRTFSDCALKYRHAKEGLPREQSGALTWGTVLHEVVQRLEEWHIAKDPDPLDRALKLFREHWSDPESLDASLKIDYFLPRTSWKKYLDDGQGIIKKWWGIHQWDTDTVLAREYQFTVPVPGTDHELTGTLDRLALRYMGSLDEHVVLIQDYKTNSKMPTYDYLQHDIQFTAYSFATTRPEFWVNLPRGDELYQLYADKRRWGEWIHLRIPKRMDAGERTDMHYARLRYAIQAMGDAIALGVFVPTISGTSCTYCEFRKPCGLPTLEQEGYLKTIKTPG